MKTNYKEAKDLIKKQSQVEELKAQIANHNNERNEDKYNKLKEKANKTVESYTTAQEKAKARDKRDAGRFSKRVADYIEAYTKDSYDASVRKVLLSNEKEVREMKVLAKAKIKDLAPKREYATTKTRVFKAINRERKPIWDRQKVGTALMGAVAVGGMATAMAVSAFEGQPIDHEIAATVAMAGVLGTSLGGVVGSEVRDTSTNNKGHRIVQAYYELKEAKQHARLKAIQDVTSGAVKPEDVLSERDMNRYENIHGKKEAPKDSVTIVLDNSKKDSEDLKQEVLINLSHELGDNIKRESFNNIEMNSDCMDDFGGSDLDSPEA